MAMVVLGLVAALVVDGECEVGGVAAAELVLARSRGQVAVVVVEHEVAKGLAGNLAPFHHHVEVEHELRSLG